ncbi:hypothetical protein LSG23_20505 (plasmid) [Bacillus velezensis]|uniref:hypothetical protein n=1 Tax=Bacillus velezensis TaxID=492670 RepID=UPI0009880034|nr:hypothetical protein [Bacillus velezensis]AQS42501.1 hypothetical protein BVH55_00465 [Bacillus velezensis]WNR83209.1 hypothetical protein RP314_20825 [Bacillus velezensis]
MVKKYVWHEIAGSDLPQYTYIPDDMKVLAEEKEEPFNLKQKYVAWFLDKSDKDEVYVPLIKREGVQ